MAWCLSSGYIFMVLYLVKQRDNFIFYAGNMVTFPVTGNSTLLNLSIRKEAVRIVIIMAA